MRFVFLLVKLNFKDYEIYSHKTRFLEKYLFIKAIMNTINKNNKLFFI